MDWLEQAVKLSCTPADFYSGARKILRNQTLTFPIGKWTIQDSGFTKSKLSMLRRNYYNVASIDAAHQLWLKRLEQNKYGSIGFSTYNHFMKGDVGGKTPRGSVMGPCIQAITLTLLKDRVAVDIFYRTTEFFKKFPADLVFIRDELLKPFGLLPTTTYTWHFANITMHPMYFVTIVPLLGDEVFDVLEHIRRSDKYFFDWLIKWSARYICKEHNRGIQKFSQALRVQRDANDRIGRRTLERLRIYFRKHHPGHRNKYEDEDETD